MDVIKGNVGPHISDSISEHLEFLALRLPPDAVGNEVNQEVDLILVKLVAVLTVEDHAIVQWSVLYGRWLGLLVLSLSEELARSHKRGDGRDNEDVWWLSVLGI